ncbi:MAG: hypothetical protein WC503_01640 [Candidatus Shapirobacteria bacterium]
MAKNDLEGVVLRAVIFDVNNNIPLIRHRSGWFGLPGGHIKKNEVGEGIELISDKIPLPLIREVHEECVKLDISKDKSACLGLVETNVTFGNNDPQHLTAVIYVVKHPEIINIGNSKRLILTSLDNLPAPLFPDAQKTFDRLKAGGKGTIFPEFLNRESTSIANFEMSSRIIGYTS